MRNKKIDPKAIEEAPFRYNAALCAGLTVLAIQDTTTLVYQHTGAEPLGGGLRVHSTLGFDWDTQTVIGLLDQRRWAAGRPQERDHWELASRAIDTRLASTANVIRVCDRETDLFDYIANRGKQGHRFIVGATDTHRTILGLDRVKNHRAVTTHDVFVGQREARPPEVPQGNEPAREASTVAMALRADSVRLISPTAHFLGVHAVYAREELPTDPGNAMEWTILTTEPIENAFQTRAIVEYYAYRRLIDEFHQTWKHMIEKRRLQAPANLERLAVITAHVAARLLQLRRR